MNRVKRMKLGRRKAFLRRCILAQELISKHENNTTIRRRVFEEHIEPILLCSYRSFDNMLNVINPIKELEAIDEELNNL